MRSALALVVIVALAAGCSDDDGEQRPLTRIDGPAEVDPEFVENRTDNRSDPGG